MIAFKDGGTQDEDLPKQDTLKNLQKLLDVIYNDPEFYPGSYHKEIDISYIIQAIYQILFEEKNNSVHIIIDKKENESLDLTIDKIE